MIIEDNEVFKTIDSISKLSINTIIVTGNNKLELKNIMASIQFDYLIISSGVSYCKRKQIIKQCNELGIEFYDVRNEGSYVYEI
jgi:ribosomal protein L32E